MEIEIHPGSCNPIIKGADNLVEIMPYPADDVDTDVRTKVTGLACPCRWPSRHMRMMWQRWSSGCGLWRISISDTVHTAPELKKKSGQTKLIDGMMADDNMTYLRTKLGLFFLD